MNKDCDRAPVERTVRLTIPENAYDVTLGNDMITQGLLYKTTDEDGGWTGHFKSFGSIEQSPVAMRAKRIIRNKTRVDVYA